MTNIATAEFTFTHALETAQRDRAELTRPDGASRYSQVELSERLAQAAAAVNEAYAVLDSALASEQTAVQGELKGLGSFDPRAALDLLNDDELDRAGQLKPFIADDVAAGANDYYALVARIEAAMANSDRAALALYLRELSGRPLYKSLVAKMVDRLNPGASGRKKQLEQRFAELTAKRRNAQSLFRAAVSPMRVSF